MTKTPADYGVDISLHPKALLYRVVLFPRPVEEKIGRIIKPEEAIVAEKLSTQVCYVVDIGPMALKEHGPTLGYKVGDWILVAKYGGMRVNIGNIEYRLINDDEAIGLVHDPDVVVNYRHLHPRAVKG